MHMTFIRIHRMKYSPEKMSYDLNGEKVILSVNVINYSGFNRDRNGTEIDEKNIINTFKVSTTIIQTYMVGPIKKIDNFQTQHGFDVKLRLSGNVKRDDVLRAIKDFVRKAPNKPHELKMLTIVFMAHGLENDW